MLHADPGSTSKVQLGLFSPQLPETGRLDVTLARLATLVGEGNAGQAVLDDTHTPEGFHIEPFRVEASESAEPVSPNRARVCANFVRHCPRPWCWKTDSPEHSFFVTNAVLWNGPTDLWLKGGEWWNESVGDRNN